ncbi:hypothetical protein CHS0354_035149 [Potamilus streckersoni]|uniref:Uncharacterized protein n=1 Tax=Potamilus streckersoni TaxID=2493646 RepID=A0AAE0WCI4_9BIVA|nr:hypothetical protein CHS0354_035149 [Potamilus streckersoni]
MEENDPKTIYPYPGGKARSHVWTYFGFYKAQEGPSTKDNLETIKIVCKLCRKVALDMADVKVNVTVETGTPDEHSSDILLPLPTVPLLLNIRDGNAKTMVTPSSPNKKAKVNINMDD